MPTRTPIATRLSLVVLCAVMALPLRSANALEPSRARIAAAKCNAPRVASGVAKSRDVTKVVQPVAMRSSTAATAAYDPIDPWGAEEYCAALLAGLISVVLVWHDLRDDEREKRVAYENCLNVAMSEELDPNTYCADPRAAWDNARAVYNDMEFVVIGYLMVITAVCGYAYFTT